MEARQNRVLDPLVLESQGAISCQTQVLSKRVVLTQSHRWSTCFYLEWPHISRGATWEMEHPDVGRVRPGFLSAGLYLITPLVVPGVASCKWGQVFYHWVPTSTQCLFLKFTEMYLFSFLLGYNNYFSLINEQNKFIYECFACTQSVHYMCAWRPWRRGLASLELDFWIVMSHLCGC